MKILDAVQECSGLRLLVTRSIQGRPVTYWLHPPEGGLSVEEAERLIEEQGLEVQGRL